MDPERVPLTAPDGPGLPATTSTDAVPALLADFSNKVLAVKEGETFFYSDVEGNLDDRREYGLGLYHQDTRFLSHFQMSVSGREPVLLSSSSERASMSHFDLTNPQLYDASPLAVPHQ